MYAQVEKPKENKSRAVANSVVQKTTNMRQSFGFVDNRPEALQMQKLQQIANNMEIGNEHSSIADGSTQCYITNGGNKRSSTVQRKFITSRGVMDKEEDMGIGPYEGPSAISLRLFESSDYYYVPAKNKPDFTKDEIRVLERRKYLLGEEHGDGTWATRTDDWGYIQKMLEGLKGFEAETDVHRQAIVTSNNTLKDQSEDIQGNGQSLPLEDRHAYTLTRMLMQQQMFNDYNNLKQLSDGRDLIQNGIEEISILIVNYAEVGLKWAQLLDNRPEGRGENFLAVGLDQINGQGWSTIQDVAVKKVASDALTDKQVKGIQSVLKMCIDNLMELIDKRPLGGGIFGCFQTRQGQDPITNRREIKNMSAIGGRGSNIVGALNEGNPLREKAMIANVQNAGFPLLVQVGNNHVDNLSAAVNDSVPVKKGVDFETLITKKSNGPKPARLTSPLVAFELARWMGGSDVSKVMESLGAAAIERYYTATHIGRIRKGVDSVEKLTLLVNELVTAEGRGVIKRLGALSLDYSAIGFKTICKKPASEIVQIIRDH